MNAPLREPLERLPGSEAGRVPSAPALHLLALAAAGRMALEDSSQANAPADAPQSWLQALSQRVGDAHYGDWLHHPPLVDHALHALAAHWRLGPLETLATALAVAVEFDPHLARALAWLQTPVGGSRPTLGLVQAVARAMGVDDDPAALACGTACHIGLLQWSGPQDGQAAPLHERALQVPLPLALLLRGQAPRGAGPASEAQPGLGLPGVRELAVDAAAWPPSLQQAARQQARALSQAMPPAHGAGHAGPALVVRSGHPREALAACALVAAACGRAAVVLGAEAPAGLAPWLWLRGALPVWNWAPGPGPGESRPLPALAGWNAPVLVAAGLEGSVDADGDPLPVWTVPMPDPQERSALWQRSLPPALAQQLGAAHRHGAAHIDHLARAARHQARLDGDDAVQAHHVHRAARQGALGELGTLAQRVTDEVPDQALVVPVALREQLQALSQRCRRREALAAGLGLAASTRYRSGVRALLVGPSGTGKTLAASWLATALGLPLYRVDLAAVASKYIGETEKNLAQLFARAEQAEVVLLFDEADSLFGKRTDVKDANDRHANQQTNYLLQRMEGFDGIAVLTSNSRTRLDGAFTRRLDMIIEFPSPGPEERKALWLAHLGPRHQLADGDLNRVAALCDLAGGHIRNVVLAAAARAAGGPIGPAELMHALAAEHNKLGRPLPTGLARG